MPVKSKGKLTPKRHRRMTLAKVTRAIMNNQVTGRMSDGFPRMDGLGWPRAYAPDPRQIQLRKRQLRHRR